MDFKQFNMIVFITAISSVQTSLHLAQNYRNMHVFMQAHLHDPEGRAPPSHHILITGAQTAAFAQICKVFLSFSHVLVDLVQPFINPLQLLWMTEGGITEDGGFGVKV